MQNAIRRKFGSCDILGALIIMSTIRKFEYTDILGWSHSRFNTFSICKRNYYYTYYGKWDKPELKIRINTLKRLTSIALEVGNISHKIIWKTLLRLQKSSVPIDPERFWKYARQQSQQIIAPKTFQEIYYEDLNKIDFDEHIFKWVEMALTNFLESKRLEWLFNEAMKNKQEWYLPSEDENDKDFGECRIDGMKAYCKVDFLFPIGDELHVVDWKTGKEDDRKYADQLKGYVTWAAFHFEKDFDLIKPTVAYLQPEYKEVSVSLNNFDIDEFAGKIRKQSEEMYEYCEDKDLNIPLAKTQFPLTENRKICEYCNFRELCDRV